MWAPPSIIAIIIIGVKKKAQLTIEKYGRALSKISGMGRTQYLALQKNWDVLESTRA